MRKWSVLSINIKKKGIQNYTMKDAIPALLKKYLYV